MAKPWEHDTRTVSYLERKVMWTDVWYNLHTNSSEWQVSTYTRDGVDPGPIQIIIIGIAPILVGLPRILQ